MERLRISILLFCLAAPATSAAEEDSIVIKGPAVSVPSGIPGKSLSFNRRFAIPRKKAERLHQEIIYRRTTPIDAVKAIEAAKASVMLGDSEDQLLVSKLELLKVRIGPHDHLDYFLISVRVNGAEEHRVVLRDGTVLKPDLTPESSDVD